MRPVAGGRVQLTLAPSLSVRTRSLRMKTAESTPKEPRPGTGEKASERKPRAEVNEVK